MPGDGQWQGQHAAWYQNRREHVEPVRVDLNGQNDKRNGDSDDGHRYHHDVLENHTAPERTKALVIKFSLICVACI